VTIAGRIFPCGVAELEVVLSQEDVTLHSPLSEIEVRVTEMAMRSGMPMSRMSSHRWLLWCRQEDASRMRGELARVLRPFIRSEVVQ